MDKQKKQNQKIGRTTRLQFWVVLLLFLTPGLFIIEFSTSWIGLIALLVLAIPIVHVHIGRWHDLGQSGWMTLLLFIPYVGLIISIPLLFLKGEEKNNQYGPNPYVDKFSDLPE